MEKNNEVLNDLAKICDLIEKLDIDIKSQTIIFELSKVEFEKVFDMVQKKYNRRMPTPKDTFTIAIGKADIVFNTNNV